MAADVRYLPANPSIVTISAWRWFSAGLQLGCKVQRRRVMYADRAGLRMLGIKQVMILRVVSAEHLPGPAAAANAG